jgi:hypothetical protein
MLDEGGLNRVERIAPGESFDGQNVGAVEADGEGEAGIDPAPRHEDRAGAALAPVAALLRPGETEPFAQEIKEGDARIVEFDRARLTVDGQRQTKSHAETAPGPASCLEAFQLARPFLPTSAAKRNQVPQFLARMRFFLRIRDAGTVIAEGERFDMAAL